MCGAERVTVWMACVKGTSRQSLSFSTAVHAGWPRERNMPWTGREGRPLVGCEGALAEALRRHPAEWARERAFRLSPCTRWGWNAWRGLGFHAVLIIIDCSGASMGRMMVCPGPWRDCGRANCCDCARGRTPGAARGRSGWAQVGRGRGEGVLDDGVRRSWEGSGGWRRVSPARLWLERRLSSVSGAPW
jgi:hypothetical protein